MVKKIKIYKNFQINNIHKGSIILIGNFDGLPSGHQKLFNEAKIFKKKFNINLGVITFDPIPKMFFNRKIKNYRISNFYQKKSYFEKFNVDFLINKKFNKKFSRITCDEFIKKILYKKINAKYIFVSNNFRFGYKRLGDIKLLKKYESLFKYKVINPKPLVKNNKIISSTLIRKLIQTGNLSAAKKILTRNWSLEGIVEKGRMMGKKIGFPTCNINIKNYIMPKLGVYAVKAKIENRRKIYKGIANLGYRPTFNQKKILLEVNLFNFYENLYNKKLSVEFLKFIRGEKKFNGVDDLRNQIKKDILIAKKIK